VAPDDLGAPRHAAAAGGTDSARRGSYAQYPPPYGYPPPGAYPPPYGQQQPPYGSVPSPRAPRAHDAPLFALSGHAAGAADERSGRSYPPPSGDPYAQAPGGGDPYAQAPGGDPYAQQQAGGYPPQQQGGYAGSDPYQGQYPPPGGEQQQQQQQQQQPGY